MGWDLENINAAATLVTAGGGPGTDVMGGNFWNTPDAPFEGLYSHPDNLDDLFALTTQFSAIMWVRNSIASNSSFHGWAGCGVNEGARLVQSGSDESNPRWEVEFGSNDYVSNSNSGTLTIDGDPAEWHLVMGVFTNGEKLDSWVIDNSDGSADLLKEVTHPTSQPINWPGNEAYGVGCLADGPDPGDIREERGQHCIPMYWFADALDGSDLEAVYAARNSATYESVVLALNPIHFINESDGLTDTVDLAGPTWDGSFVRNAAGDKTRVRMPNGDAASVRLPAGGRL